MSTATHVLIGRSHGRLPARHTQWIAPTIRATRPTLLTIAAVAGVVAAGGIVAGASDVALPVVYVQLAAAALATAVVVVDDSAAELLDALPAGAGRRLAHRTAITSLAAVIAWIVGGWLITTVTAPPGTGAAIGRDIPALLALTAVTVACRRCVAWGAAVPLALVAGARMVEASEPLVEILLVWWTDPWPVLAGAAVAVVATVRTSDP